MDPANAKIIVQTAAATLSEIDPAHADTYQANASRVVEDLATLSEELAALTADLADKRYIVFHDAYQYFEARFGLNPAGSITVSPEVMPGAQRVQEMRDRVVSENVLCIFAEPQFEPRLVATIAEGTGVRTAVLDPLGADIADGPNLYPTLLRTFARDLGACLRDE